MRSLPKMKYKFSILTVVFFSAVQCLCQINSNTTVLDNWDGYDVPFNGAAKYNDVWGFTIDSTEYACIGSTLGTHLFSISETGHLTDVGYVPGKFQGAVVHRDFAFYEGYLYAVCDQGSSSLQVIDVSNLPSGINVVLDDTTHITTAHNVTVDPWGEKLYISGPSGSAMKVFDLANTPETPELINTFMEVGYVHDVYAKEDIAYLSCGNQGLFIYDFSDPSSPQIISSIDGYPDEGYNHSGWLSPDGRYYAFADETPWMKMKIIDVTDPSDLQVVSLFNSGRNPSTMPHNLEWIGDKIYVSHYFDGLQIFDVSDVANPVVCGYFDTYPLEDVQGRGAWGVHVLPSGRILISDRQTGLYVFHFDDDSDVRDLQLWTYPNPTESDICLNLMYEGWVQSDEYLERLDWDQIEIKIFSDTGEKVFDRTIINNEQPFNTIRLKTNDWNSGIYFIHLRLNEEDDWRQSRFLKLNSLD